MPREIVTRDGATFRFRDYDLPSLGPQDVRVRTTFASPKHGTETHAFADAASSAKVWDPGLRMFLPHPNPPALAEPGERGMGNIVVGTVTHVGAGVRRFAPGDSVFGYGPIRETHQAPEDGWQALGALSPADAVCTDPAHVAFVAVRDGNIRVGDDVAVFGLGAIGQMAVQIARAAGARRVLAVDPVALRRECARTHGADAAFDPTAGDAALAVKRATDDKGVDAALETSGNGRALHEAVRGLRQCGTVVHVAWGPKSCADLRLDEEWHLNRPTLVGSQCWEGWGNPDRSHLLWDGPRQRAAVRDLFERRLLTGQDVVTPIVPFDQAPAALADIFRAPERTIKVGVTFPEGRRHSPRAEPLG